MTSREQFESWFKSDFHPDKTGPYLKETLFFAWQAASKASEQQLAAVVAENAGLKAENDQALQCMAEFRVNLSMYKKFKYQSDVKTPATDAYLAEVRAQGVEMFASSLKVLGPHEHPYSTAAKEFAAQLRQGAAL